MTTPTLRRRDALALPLLAAPLAAAPPSGGALAQGAPVEWRFHNSYAPTRIESADIRAFVEDANRIGAGRLRLALSEGNAMNLRDADALRWMQPGTPEMGFIWPPFLGRDAPGLASLYVYGSVSDAAEHLRAFPVLREILAEGLRGWNIEMVGLMPLTLLAGTVLAREPVRDLAELRRRKLRVGTREQVETFRALGVAAQIVPQQELYTAMQTGVVDCALYPARIAHTVSLQEVARHGVDTGFPFPPVPYAVMAHGAKWRALSEPAKGAIREAAAILESRASRYDDDPRLEAEARDRLSAGGVTWHGAFPEADRRAIREAALRTWEAIAREAGGPAPAWRERVARAVAGTAS